MKQLHLGLFVSGRGTNFQAIAEAVARKNLDAEIRLLVSSNPEAGALSYAADHGIPAQVIAKDQFPDRGSFVNAMISALRDRGVDTIALAGYMKKVPPEVVQAYHHRIFNIHPALLPSFGGQGMYGIHVHEAVLAAGCKVTGVTVHVVDEVYDRGPIVAQACVPVKTGDTPEALAARVLKTEHDLYWRTLQLVAEERVAIREGRAEIM